MKILHLAEAAASPSRIDFHDQITLVRDLDPARRSWLITQLGSLGSGGAVYATGELEAHGIRFDLDSASLSLLGVRAGSSDVVVCANDLPGHDPAKAAAVAAKTEAARSRDLIHARLESTRGALVDAVTQRDAASAEVEELRRGEGRAAPVLEANKAESSRLEAELKAARKARRDAQTEIEAATAQRLTVTEERSAKRVRIDAAQNRRRVAVGEATQAAAALEDARSGLDLRFDPAAAASEAAERLSAAERAVADLDPGDDSPLSGHLVALERRRVELSRLETAVGDTDADAVATALDKLAGASHEGAPVVAALALADSWRDLHQQISALEAGVSEAERTAERNVASARQAVVEAETEFNQPILTPEQISKVEAAHHAVLEAQDRAESRFGGSRARRRVEELRSDERRVLERLGFSTYADYMMSSSNRAVGPSNRAVLDVARSNLAAANDQLSSLPGAADRARRRTELLQRRDAVAPRVADLLGHEPTGPEAEDELRSMREPTPADEPAVEELADALIGAGVDVGPGPHDRDDVVLLARAYVAEVGSAEVDRAEAATAIAALDMAIGELRSARDRGETDVPTDLDLPALAQPVTVADPLDGAEARTLREARWAEVESARAAQAEAEAVATRHQDVLAAITQMESALAQATSAEATAADDVAQAESELGDGLEPQVAEAAEWVSQAERALSEAQALEHRLSDEIEARHGVTGAEALITEVEERLRTAESGVVASAAAEQTAAAELATADTRLNTAIDAELNAQATEAARDRSDLVNDFDWQLISRLARLRSVGPGGSVPLILDDPFTALHDDEVGPVLDRLGAMAGAVQVVVISDREAVAAWAAQAGPDRVAVLDAA